MNVVMIRVTDSARVKFYLSSVGQDFQTHVFTNELSTASRNALIFIFPVHVRHRNSLNIENLPELETLNVLCYWRPPVRPIRILLIC